MKIDKSLDLNNKMYLSIYLKKYSIYELQSTKQDIMLRPNRQPINNLVTSVVDNQVWSLNN